MLSRMGQLPPGAHVRLTGANLRLASSLSALTEPRTLASDTPFSPVESRNGRKRAWQPFTEGEELPHTATWLDGSAANLWQSGSKFTKPDDWLPAAPEMQQPDLSVALGELADDFFDFSPAVGYGLLTDGEGYPDHLPFL